MARPHRLSIMTIGVYGFDRELTPVAAGPRPGRDRLRAPPELAAISEPRLLQYAGDDRQGVGKRSRRELAAEYTRRCAAEILNSADLTPIVSAWSRGGIAALSASSVARKHATAR